MRTPEVGVELVDPARGTRTVFVATAASTDGAHVEVEARYPPRSTVPPRHLHPGQAEHFTVLQGRLRTVVDGVERDLAPGDELDVPVGAVHQVHAVADTETVFRWRTTPALRTDALFCELWQCAADSGWAPAPAALLGVVSRFPEEFRLA